MYMRDSRSLSGYDAGGHFAHWVSIIYLNYNLLPEEIAALSAAMLF